MEHYAPSSDATWIARQAHQRTAVAASHLSARLACRVPGRQRNERKPAEQQQSAPPHQLGSVCPRRPPSALSARALVTARDHPASPPSAPSATSSSFCQPRRLALSA
ncbi:hypothetical protein BFW01_g1054 [Lasiodiplodia theobromae]|uniref:Uncharacterized protein n=2 Tax=Lasiodiplodia TaxID=66739 RepID=A0A5N5D958_9PEZI|nr:hypothetical protein DBV05_g7487 [Lasiodiplodia theobromae]KAF9630492.1 hypothetical protein BFW01_g1054 [Lasiodiplodia theobromae]KAK0653564.1 hypothetical protein DIS24_g6015 [Lasiodiplodia hormozganensis]